MRGYPRPFNLQRGTLRLGVDEGKLELGELHDKVVAKGFARKGELHISLIGFKSGRKIKDKIHTFPQDKMKRLKGVRRLIAETDWTFLLHPPEGPEALFLSKEYAVMRGRWASEKEWRQSCVVMVDVPALDGFYVKLNEMLDMTLLVPPAHITLYTRGNSDQAKMGIGIESREDLAGLNPQPIVASLAAGIRLLED